MGMFTEGFGSEEEDQDRGFSFQRRGSCDDERWERKMKGFPGGSISWMGLWAGSRNLRMEDAIAIIAGFEFFEFGSEAGMAGLLPFVQNSNKYFGF